MKQEVRWKMIHIGQSTTILSMHFLTNQYKHRKARVCGTLAIIIQARHPSRQSHHTSMNDILIIVLFYKKHHIDNQFCVFNEECNVFGF